VTTIVSPKIPTHPIALARILLRFASRSAPSPLALWPNHRALCHAAPSGVAPARPLAQTSSFQNFFAGHSGRVRLFKKLQIAVI